uniref:FecR family protein n=1 Tax=Pedobacter schmidteae TaxID=2201271 RepID=UPI000EAC708B|nr:FecR family protein [Pedobacter schmidteae]
MKAPEHLDLLIDKYLSGAATDEEKNQLLAWYDSQDHHEVEWPSAGPNEEQDVYGRLLAKIDAGTSAEVVLPRRGLIGWYKIIAAALIFIVASVGGYLYLNHQGIEHTEALSFKNDIAPASSKTILKLANGKELQLEDANGEELRQLGQGQIRKTEDGQLIYDLSAAKRITATEAVYNSIVTPKGIQYQVVLSDGTKVWLNAASSLRFPNYFNGKERLVETTGEVYFEVAKDHRHPFIVRTARQTIEVLGTHFNVNAYGDEGLLKTTLLEGSVKISVTGGIAEKILKPGEQAQISNSGSIKITRPDLEESMAWKNNLFQFNNTSIEQVMLQVKRWYDIDLVYEGAKPNLLFTGVIPKNNNISILLKVLESTGGIKFGIEGKKVIIQSSPIKNQTDMRDR